MASGIDTLLQLGAAATGAKAVGALQLTAGTKKRAASPVTPVRLKSPMVSQKVAAQGIREYKER